MKDLVLKLQEVQIVDLDIARNHMVLATNKLLCNNYEYKYGYYIVDDGVVKKVDRDKMHYFHEKKAAEHLMDPTAINLFYESQNELKKLNNFFVKRMLTFSQEEKQNYLLGVGEDLNSNKEEFVSYFLNQVEFGGILVALHLCKVIIFNDIKVREIFVDPIKKHESFIKSSIINDSYNILKNESVLRNYNYCNDENLDNICYSIAFSNVLKELIHKELELCNGNSEVILKKYSNFKNIIIIKLELIGILLSHSFRLILLQNKLISMMKKNLKRRAIILIIFMGICKLIKNSIISIIGKIIKIKP